MSDDAQITLREQLAQNLAAAGEGEVTVTDTPVENTTTESVETTTDRARDELGRFTAKQQAEAQAEKVDQQAAPTEPPPAPARPPRPSSWKKEYWDHWEKIDPNLAEYLNQRESEFAKGVSTYKTEWERAKPILDALTPFQQEMQRHNISPDQWIAQMGGWHSKMVNASPQEKLMELQRIAQHYGVPLQTPGDDGQTPQADPHSQWLVQQVNELRGKLTTWESMQQQQEQQALQAQLAEFAGAHKHYEAVRETMAGLLQAGLASDLNEAYEAALRHPKHNDIWQAEQETLEREQEAKVAEEKRAQAARARSQAVQVKGTTPGTPTTSDAKDLRSQLRDNLRAVEGRV